MANTYTQIYLHIIFAVKYRTAQIPTDKASNIYAYMASVINNYQKCRAINIGGVADHVHVLMRMSTVVNIAEIVKAVKVATTMYINSEIHPKGQFAWQEGYGVFSISSTHTDALNNYINNQATHHLSVNFADEYVSLLKKNGVDYDPKFIFEEMK